MREGQALVEVYTGFDASLEEFRGETNHVHLLATCPPQVQLPKLVNNPRGVFSMIVVAQLWGRGREYPSEEKVA